MFYTQKTVQIFGRNFLIVIQFAREINMAIQNTIFKILFY